MGGALCIKNRDSGQNPRKTRQNSRKTGAPHRALPRHHLSWFGAWSAMPGWMPGIGCSLHRTVLFPWAGRSDRSRPIGRCRCLAMGNVYRGCDKSDPCWREREKTVATGWEEDRATGRVCAVRIRMGIPPVATRELPAGSGCHSPTRSRRFSIDPVSITETSAITATLAAAPPAPIVTRPSITSTASYVSTVIEAKSAHAETTMR